MAKLRGVSWVAVSSEEQAKADKLSLDEQLAQNRAWADANNVDIIREFVWDGYSRWEADIVTALEDFAAHKRYQYHELRAMWQAKAFDVLICHEQARLGRSFTLQSWVIENVIRSGASIYRIIGGWIGRTDYAMNIAMGGFSNTTNIESFVAKTQATKDANIQNGIMAQGRVPISHKYIFDDRGKKVQIVVNEKYRQMFLDMATLFLEGVSLEMIEVLAKERYGHMRSNGKPHYLKMYYRFLHNPTFWGHTARGYNTKEGSKFSEAQWTYDDTVPPPDYAKIARNTHEPMYTGALAEAVKAELDRRHEIQGQKRPDRTYRFSGLLVCADCDSQYRVTLGAKYVRKDGGYSQYVGMQCQRAAKGECQNRQSISFVFLQKYFDAMLRAHIQHNQMTLLTLENNVIDTSPLEAEHARLSKEIDYLIESEINAPNADVRARYKAQVAVRTEQVTTLERRIREAQEANTRSETQRRQSAYTMSELQSMTLEQFWAQSDTAINQFLHRVVGRRRFIARGKEIIDLKERQRFKRS